MVKEGLDTYNSGVWVISQSWYSAGHVLGDFRVGIERVVTFLASIGMDGGAVDQNLGAARKQMLRISIIRFVILFVLAER